MGKIMGRTSNNQSQDVIIQKQDLLMSLVNLDQIALLKNPRYLTLVEILHKKGPLTLSDMAKEYAILAKNDQAKSESTVYRYFSTLKQQGIIQEVGQKIVEGKALSQTLYSLAAKYIIIDELEIDWQNDTGRKIFKDLVKIMKILYPEKPIDEKALFQWQLRFQEVVDSNKKKIINSEKPELLELLSAWAPYDPHDFFEYLGWHLVLLTYPSAQEDFLNCFNKATVLEDESSSSMVNDERKMGRVTFKDVIRRFPELFCNLSESDHRTRFLEKPAYLPLFHVLRDGTFTIKELTERYNQVASVPRKASTITRYVKKLKDANLVIEVGQRVIHGEKATQKLYGPIARLISFHGKYEPDWESETRLFLLDSLIKILNYLYPHYSPINKECYQKFRITASSYEAEGNKKITLPENRKILELLHKYEWKDYYILYTSLWDYYYFMNIPNLVDRLMKCFSE